MSDEASRRQRVERMPGSRRARLTAAPGTESDAPDDDGPDAGAAAPEGERAAGTSGPNDERMRRDVPPHY